MVDGHYIRLVLTYITDRLTCKADQKFPIQCLIQLHNNMANIQYNNRGITVPVIVTMEMEYLHPYMTTNLVIVSDHLITTIHKFCSGLTY